MSYNRNNDANRDALFGGSSSRPSSSSSGGNAGPKYKRNHTANRDTLFGGGGGGGAPKRATPRAVSGGGGGAARPSAASARPSAASARSSRLAVARSGRSALPPAAKAAKMAEAEELRVKAKKAMTRGMFSRPDPVVAGTYYRQAAEIYARCDENRLERLHRIASADCQRGQGSWALAAAEYTRAAELVAVSAEKVARKRTESYQLHRNAAECWREMGETAKAGESSLKSGLGLLLERTDEEKLAGLDDKARTALEEAVEVFVPDPLNRYGHLRRSPSAHANPDDDDDSPKARYAAAERARDHVPDAPYAHETIQKAVTAFVEHGDLRGASYAAGAATASLELGGNATISLSRAYLVETVLRLAARDVVGADRTFLEHHLQRDAYLTSRECKAAEELLAAVRDSDQEKLDEARAENRGALANLDPVVRTLATSLRVSGSARPPPPATTTDPERDAPPPKIAAAETGARTDQERARETEDNFNEMMDIMNEMGLGDDDDDDDDDVRPTKPPPRAVEEPLEDDEIDLR